MYAPICTAEAATTTHDEAVINLALRGLDEVAEQALYTFHAADAVSIRISIMASIHYGSTEHSPSPDIYVHVYIHAHVHMFTRTDEHHGDGVMAD